MLTYSNKLLSMKRILNIAFEAKRERIESNSEKARIMKERSITDRQVKKKSGKGR